jgi:hypothetical protein
MVRAVPGSRLLLLLLAVLITISPAASSAATTPPGTVGECLQAGQVWLYVETDAREVLRSECVGRPATGLAALEAAGVRTTESSGGYLCTLAGYPEQCPARYAGRYWQYSHAADTETSWSYARQGADTYAPPPGSIEGWCYNRADEERCTLPRLSPSDLTAPRVDLAAPADTGGRWTLVVAVVILGLLGVAVLVLRRRSTAGAAPSP